MMSCDVVMSDTSGLYDYVFNLIGDILFRWSGMFSLTISQLQVKIYFKKCYRDWW